MLTRRVIACLDVKGGRVVKGVRFESLRDVGDPVELATRYESQGADEIVFLDISASAEERATLLDVVRRTAERLFIPLTVGGGVRSADDVAQALRAGADKVSINSAAVARPEILSECAARFGSQCVVASIDAARDDGGWRVFTHGGKTSTDREAVAWARECVRHGAGEILLTSIDRDGARGGGVGARVRGARRGRDPAHQHRPGRRPQWLRPRSDPRGVAGGRGPGDRLRRRRSERASARRGA